MEDALARDVARMEDGLSDESPKHRIGRTFHVDSIKGSDTNPGSKQAPWKTLAHANKTAYGPGDRLRLKCGSVFHECLKLTATGSPEAPMKIHKYGKGAKPVIDAAGYRVALHLVDCSNVYVSQLEITADGGDCMEPDAEFERYGVLVEYQKARTPQGNACTLIPWP